MALRYRIDPAAKQELVDAAAYHEQQREGFGLRLFDEYDALIEHALDFPDSGKRVDLDSGHEVRCFQMRRFRYSVFAAIVGDKLRISPERGHADREHADSGIACVDTEIAGMWTPRSAVRTAGSPARTAGSPACGHWDRRPWTAWRPGLWITDGTVT